MRPILSSTEFKDTYYGIGLMSGTSLDGLDIAICSFDLAKEYQPKMIHFNTVSWPSDLETLIRKCTSVENVSLYDLTYLNRKGAEFFADAIQATLKIAKISKKKIDFIGSHGHTIYHIPSHNSPDGKAATLQLIDADQIARKLGVVTISDFRQKHIAAGGEGAPLVVYGDYSLFASPIQHRILLNLGGMANLTWLPANSSIDSIVTSDTGPANKLIDLAVQEYDSSLKMDVDGKLASQGKVNQEVLNLALEDPFFKKAFPKSTGPELFNKIWMMKLTEHLSHVDRIATMTALTAKSVSIAIKQLVGQEDAAVYVSGGGASNRTLISMIAKYLPETIIAPFDELGFSADSKEAVLFCWLGFQTYLGMNLSSPKKSGIQKPVLLGKISIPD
ncbi:anhydro-N-acetylmuramic acid kinase [bacterium]|nr:MAG: anhydro-N-acetylmuramic acid kinase [bacterium]